jgi:anhydro-N-acetylmuramic acid kinase
MPLYIGLMSGTSMDGIDAAIVDTSTHTLIYGITKPYEQELKYQLEQLTKTQLISLADLKKLDTWVGHAFSEAVNDLLKQANMTKKDIKAIGSHGQTIAHNTKTSVPYTVQIGCAHTIAEHTGIPVVADFRTRDLVLGGQGAPFAPIYHQQLFANMSDEDVAIINIGGIANISIVSKTKPISGWDVGPGNCLLDAWIEKQLHQSYDHDGAWAKTGQIDHALLHRLQQDAFFKEAAPKSLGKEYFALSKLEALLPENYNPADVQATLIALTAFGIELAIQQCSDLPSQVFLCGGGAHNSALLDALRNRLPQCFVQSTAAIGVDPDFIEAMLLAWLASQTMQSIPIDLSTITGSRRPALLGAIYSVS